MRAIARKLRSVFARRAWLSLAASLFACAPSKPPSPSSVHSPAPLASQTEPVLAPPPPSPPPSVALPTETTPAPALAALEERIQSHYAKYVDGTRFAFFAVDFAPRVERYLSLRDINVPALQAEARRFFRDKKGLAFTPKAGTFVVKHEGTRSRVEFELGIAWRQSMSESYKECDRQDVVRGIGPGPSAIEHKVDVHAELVLDERLRFVSYAELGMLSKKLQVKTRDEPLPAFVSIPTRPARAEDSTATPVASGTLVEDLGDRFTCSQGGETDTLRKVRVDGAVVWLLEEWTWDTGHNFVGEVLLVPAPAP
jgi:hypothetical protein